MDLFNNFLNFESITLLLTFFIPGYIGLKLFAYLAVINIDNSRINIYSVVFSGVINSVNTAFFKNYFTSSIALFSIISILLSVVFFYLVFTIYKSKLFKAFNNKFLKKSHINIWEYSAEHENKQIHVIYTTDGFCYIGLVYLISYDNKKEVDWISLKHYKQLKCNNDNNNEIIIDLTDEDNVYINIRQRDIKSFSVIIN